MEWSVTVLQPAWLLPLLAVPWLVWVSRASLSGLGPVRRVFAITLRSLVLGLLLLALADVQWVQESRRLCTMFVLDVSQSIPASGTDNRHEEALDLVSEAIRRRANDRDQAGLVVVGRDARLELPPAEYPRWFQLKAIGATVDRQHTDLAAGVKLALGSFPPDCARRIVLISDGNQNRGNLIAQAAAARSSDAAIDVVPIEYRYEGEVLVDKIVIPPDLKKGDAFNPRIVLRSGRPARGTLRINRVLDRQSQTLLQQPVELRAGLNVLTIKQKLDEPDFYRYEAEFVPDAGVDRLARNNQASAFAWVRGQGEVLLVRPDPGETAVVADALRTANFRVTERSPEELGESLAGLRRYDAIVVANVPAERLPEPIQEKLGANTRELGAGLVMVGGPDSLSAGGYKGSPIEQALPVTMEFKAARGRGRGALVLLMHASEIPEGNHWQKVIAKLAVDKLNRDDLCGLVYWSGTTSWLFTLREVGDGLLMKRRIDGMSPGDMLHFDPAMNEAVTALMKAQAMNRHLIIISDGDPQPPSAATLNKFTGNKITCTTVAVSAHGPSEQTLMRNIATQTGGRYHQVEDARNLPSIYIKETRTISQSLIHEPKEAWTPRLQPVGSEVTAGLTGLPPVRGIVLTTAKPTATVPVISTQPADVPETPVVATWQHGLGRAAVVTTDGGRRWADAWTGTEAATRFWGQLLRWVSRPRESESLALSVQEADGAVRVVVNALDADREFITGLSLVGSAVSPTGQTIELNLRQTEPGKYEAEFDADQAGAWFVSASPAAGGAFVSTGLTVSYPPEYRDTESNRDLLELAATASEGRVIDWEKARGTDFFDPDRPPTRRLEPAWPSALFLALVVFLFDVAVRRLAIDLVGIARGVGRRAWAWWKGRAVAPQAATVERLRSTKREVNEELEQRQARYVIEDRPATKPDAPPLTKPVAPPSAAPPPLSPANPAEQPAEEETYTNRLLRAKNKVWEEKKGTE